MIETRSCPRCSSWFATEQINGEFSGICPQCLAAAVFSNPANPSSVRISDSGALIPIPGPSGSSALQPGGRFGGFEILDVLGEGGMGVVYKARQTSLDRIVALKVLGPRISGSEESVRRFEREAKVLATLNHPNVVQVHDFGREDGIPYLVMEHVDGESLEAALRRSRPDPAWMLRILREVARGLRRVHEAGLVHRDLKPANILITRDGTAKIGDFGLAVETSTNERLTEAGYFVGTPHYVSPEHAKGGKLDGRSDLYALGVILFEGFAGRPPFLAGSPSAVLAMHMETPAPPLERFAPQAPAVVAAVVRRLLEKDPARRYASASELEAALSAASIRRTAPTRRSRAAVLAGAAVVFLAVAGYFLWPAPATPALPFLLAADSALKADRLDEADAALREARRRVGNDPDWRLQVRELSERVAEIRTDRAAIRAGDDEEFGQFLCFSKGDWEHGLPMIAAGEESPYRSVARKDLARPADSAGCVAVADGWMEAAGRAEKPRWASRMKERAWAWLSAATSGADAAQRAAIDRRLAELDATLEARREIDLLKLANPAKFAVAGEFTLEGGRLRTPPSTPFARLSLPYLPPDEYDLELSVERRTGEGALYVGLPLPSGSAGVEIEGRLLPVEKAVRVIVSLRRDKVEASVAGTPVRAARSVADSWRVPEPRLIVVGSNASAFVLSKLTLRGTISLSHPRAAEGSGIDLLSRVDFLRDTKAGTWSKTPLGIRSKMGDKFARLQLPVELPESYDLYLTVERKEGTGALNVGLRLGGRPCCVVLDGWTGDVSGLELIDNHGADSNATTSKGRAILRPNKPVSLVCSVRPSQVQVTVDGNPLFDWKGDPARLQLHPDFIVENAPGLFLGASTSSFEISRLSLQPAGGRIVSGVGAAVDLLPRIDPARDVVEGAWKFESGALVSAPAFSSIAIPYEPPQEYDLLLNIERKLKDEAVVLVLPLGDRQVAVSLDSFGKTSGLDSIDGRGMGFTEHEGRVLTTDRELSVRCSVRQGAVKVDVGGKTIIDWKGDFSRLSLPKHLRIPDPRGFFLATWTTCRFSRVSLIEVTGSGRSIAEAATTRPVDLLPKIDLLRDAVSGDWVMQSGALVSTSKDYFSRVTVDATLPEEYDLDVVVERLAGNQDFFLGLVQGNSSFGVMLDAGNSTYCAIQAKVGNLDHADRSVLPGGSPHSILCRVRKWSVEILVDGQRVLGYRGDLSKGSMYPQWSVPKKPSLIVGSHASSHRVSRLMLLPARDGIDLLSLLRPDRDAVKGEWKKVDGVLVSPQAPEARIELPFEAPDEYDLIVTAERRSTDQRSFHLGLPIGGRAVLVTLDGFGVDRCALENLNGGPSEGPGLAYRRQVFKEVGVPVTLTCRVRRKELVISTDRDTVISWSGDPATLDLPQAWRGNHPRMPLLGVFRSEFHVRRVELIPRSGPASLDLLAMIDPRRDGYVGRWERDGGELVCAADKFARLQIPYEPPDEYDLDVLVERRSGSSLILGVVSGTPVMVSLDSHWGTLSGLDMVDGRRVEQNAATKRGKVFEDGRAALVRCSVRRDGIRVTVDGMPAVSWKGDRSRLSLSPDWKVPNPRALWVGAWDSVYRFRSIRLTPVTGAGQAAGTDLLALVDPARDTVAGQWTRTDSGLLTMTTTPFPRIVVPTTLPAEYDLTVEAERKEGIRSLILGMTSGDFPFAVLLDGWTGTTSGLDLLDGKGADKNESSVTGLPLLPLDQKATILVSVRKSGVLVRVDGRTVIDWKGESSRLSLHRNLEVPRKGLFIATWDSRFLIHRATIVAVGLTGVLNRRGPGIDLLPLIDPARDAVAGTWTGDRNGVVSDRSSYARLEIPYEPPAEYDLRVVWERLAGLGEAMQILTAGEKQFPWKFRGDPGVVHESVFQVRRNNIKQIVDGVTIMDQAFDPAKYGMPASWAIRRTNSLGLGSTETSTRFHRVELVEVTGEGRALAGLRVPVDAATGPRPGSIDLLRRIDLRLDAVSGDWQIKDGKLVSDKTERSRIEFPYQPPAEYDFRIVFSRIEGIGDINQLLTKGGRAFAWSMGAHGNTRSGFGDIRGAWSSDPKNPSRVFLGVEPGRTYESLVEVREDGVRAFLNGVLVCEWKTDYRDLSPDGPWKLRDDLLLGLGTFGSATAFHRIEIREVTGRGRHTRGETDLLALVDPVADAVHGAFSKPDGLLLTPDKEVWSRIRIPYAPPAEYDLELTGSRRTGSDNLSLGILVGGRQAMVPIGGQAGKTGGIELIDGLNFMLNPTRFDHAFLENGKPFTLTVSVRKKGIDVMLDGRPVTRWEGDPTRLSLHPQWRVPDEQSLFLCSHESSFEVRRLTLIPRSGEGRRTR